MNIYGIKPQDPYSTPDNQNQNAQQNQNQNEQQKSIEGNKLALFWAHKTGEGFVCVGYSWSVSLVETNPGIIQYQAADTILLHPGFVNPNVQPEAPGFLTYGNVYFSSPELEIVSNPSGVYSILRPLFLAGIGESDYLWSIILSDQSRAPELKKEYGRLSKRNLAITRSVPFNRSNVYRCRQSTPGSIFNSYHFPVLVELTQ